MVIAIANSLLAALDNRVGGHPNRDCWVRKLRNKLSDYRSQQGQAITLVPQGTGVSKHFREPERWLSM